VSEVVAEPMKSSISLAVISRLLRLVRYPNKFSTCTPHEIKAGTHDRRCSRRYVTVLPGVGISCSLMMKSRPLPLTSAETYSEDLVVSPQSRGRKIAFTHQKQHPIAFLVVTMSAFFSIRSLKPSKPLSTHLKKTSSPEHMVLSDKPLVDGWCLEHPNMHNAFRIIDQEDLAAAPSRTLGPPPKFKLSSIGRTSTRC
jgi:hypothetical protein